MGAITTVLDRGRKLSAEFRFSETSVGTSTGWTLNVAQLMGIPKLAIVTLTRHQVNRSGGSGANITPTVGTADPQSGDDLVAELASSSTVTASAARVAFGLRDGILYGRTNPDSASDNTADTIIGLTWGDE